jgi:propanol-preferring alcohol dehydrogenase
MPRVCDEPRRNALSRGGAHRELARSLGAEWIGDADKLPPAPLDAAILFAPAGNLVLPALEALDRGGILAIAGIHLSAIPPLDYQEHLFYEKQLRSVTANTRADGEEFLKLAADISIRAQTVAFGLGEANVALRMLKHDEIKGAAVLRIS